MFGLWKYLLYMWLSKLFDYCLIYEFEENPEVPEDLDIPLPVGLESEAETERETYDDEGAGKKIQKRATFIT